MTRAAALPSPVVTGHLNEVTLIGRVTGAPTTREMPSGDPLVSLRISVDRPRRARQEPARRLVDAIELACWSARSRAAASRVVEGELVEVHGALRRRFYRVGAAVASRHEVEVRSLRRIRAPVGGES